MKILALLLMSIVGTVKSYGYYSIVDTEQRVVGVIQITDNESSTVITQQRFISGRWIEISSVLFFIAMINAGQRKLKKHLLLIEQIREMEGVVEELKRLNSVKDRLLSIIPHDIRAPLVSLKSLLELVANKKLTADEFNQFAIEVSSHLVLVNGFIENLLNWAKKNFSQIKPSNDIVVLHRLVQETVRLLSFNARRKQVTIQTDVSDEVKICADAEMIKLVLRNLISNAIKFCNVNDKVYIRATVENEMVRVSVEDTGQGINEKRIRTLFNVSHLSARGTDDEIGVGLGLTLCKEFVEKMGGNISVLSREGEGSCFEFTVPRFIITRRSTEVLAVSSATMVSG